MDQITMDRMTSEFTHEELRLRPLLKSIFQDTVPGIVSHQLFTSSLAVLVDIQHVLNNVLARYWNSTSIHVTYLTKHHFQQRYHESCVFPFRSNIKKLNVVILSSFSNTTYAHLMSRVEHEMIKNYERIVIIDLRIKIKE